MPEQTDVTRLAEEAYPDGEFTTPAVQLAFREAYKKGHAAALAAEEARLAEAIAMGKGDTYQGFYLHIRFEHTHMSTDFNGGWQDVYTAMRWPWERNIRGFFNSGDTSPKWYEHKHRNVDYDCTITAHVPYGAVTAFLAQNGLDALLEISGIQRAAESYDVRNLRLEYISEETDA